MDTKTVKELMEPDPAMISPEATLADAARKMKEVDCGFLPVGDPKISPEPFGIITDRDIVIRAIAEGLDPAKQTVRDIMTDRIHACRDGDTLSKAAQLMYDNNVSRLVVQDDNGNVCGVLTFGRIIRTNDNADETSNVVETATGKAA